jgi:hypothetical protein
MNREGDVTEEAQGQRAGDNAVVEIAIPFSTMELERLRELAQAQFATVPEYIRACVLGPRAPGPVEVLAEILARRLGRLTTP